MGVVDRTIHRALLPSSPRRATSIYDWKTLRTFCTVRALLAIGAVATLYSIRPTAGGPTVPVATAYVALTLIALLLAFVERPSVDGQLTAAIAIDLVFVIALVSLAGGAASGFSMLYFLPVAGAALLSSRRTALLVAAIATIALLLDTSARYTAHASDVSLFQSGTLGAAMLAVSFVLNDLARRVSVQERLAIAQQAELQAQIETNRLVIRDMQQGILVVNSDGEVRAANPAARAILGVRDESRIDRRSLDAHPMLGDLLNEWVTQATRETRTRDIVIDVSNARDDGRSILGTMPVALRPRVIRVRSIPAASAAGGAPLVVYLEDLREVEAQAVQLKLASMGRLSASIAHEIRNPLAAIGHASALLSEESQDASSGRLVRIIQDNVSRLDRIVSDILAVSRSSRARAETLDLTASLNAIVDDFARGHGVARQRIAIDAPAAVPVIFDRTHLQQIVDNLLTNAVRHGSQRDGAIELVVDVAQTGEIGLSVIDDGPGVDPGVRAQLFEPFFTTYRNGTGLGLYVARELAIANRATLFLERGSPRPQGACFTLRIAAPE